MSAFPALSARILMARLAQGAVLYDLEARQLHVLNPAGAALAAACRAGAERSTAVRHWADQTGAEPAVIEADLDRSLAEFERLGVTGRIHEEEVFLAAAAAPPTPLSPGTFTCEMAAAEHRIRFRSMDRPHIEQIASLLGVDCVIGVHSSTDTLHGDGATAPTAEFTITTEPSNAVTLTSDTTRTYPTITDLCDDLVGVLNHFVSRSATHVVLHAAALADPEGRLVVFPADRNAGKSTLAAGLIRAGWTYLTDEATALGPETLRVLPYAKPLTLDASSRRALGLGERAGDQVPIGSIEPDANTWIGSAQPPIAVIVPSFRRDVPPSSEHLVFPTRLTALVENTLNLFLVEDAGLDALVRLSESVPVHRISYSDTASAVGLINELLG